MTEKVVKYLYVKGKVQNVMFRQTVMRGAIARGVIAGATNDKSDKRRVDISLEGPADKVNDMIDVMKSGKKLNSWGATVEELHINEVGKQPREHEVNTDNVDDKKWKPGVEFYL